MPERWPLRYRIAHRLHCHVNRLHRYAGTRFTWWLNCKTGSLWINWWIKSRVGREADNA